MDKEKIFKSAFTDEQLAELDGYLYKQSRHQSSINRLVSISLITLTIGLIILSILK